MRVETGRELRSIDPWWLDVENCRLDPIYDVPGGQTRGGHAYRTLHEFFVALSGSFDVVVDSSAVGMRKPDPRIFDHVLRPSLTLEQATLPHVGAQEDEAREPAALDVLHELRRGALKRSAATPRNRS